MRSSAARSDSSSVGKAAASSAIGYCLRELWGRGLALDDFADLAAVDHFLVEQDVGEPVQRLAVLGEHSRRPLLGFPHEAGHLFVDDPLRLLGVDAALALGAEVLRALASVPDRTE